MNIRDEPLYTEPVEPWMLSYYYKPRPKLVTASGIREVSPGKFEKVPEDPDMEYKIKVFKAVSHIQAGIYRDLATGNLDHLYGCLYMADSQTRRCMESFIVEYYDRLEKTFGDLK
jgi:hypothetical protein